MADDLLELADWRRRIYELYAEIRADPDPQSAWDIWRAGRDSLFRTHPQSPIPEESRGTFDAIRYFAYDPALRIVGSIEKAPAKRYDIHTSGEATMAFTRFATVSFTIRSRSDRLDLYWLEGYAGGIFLPFRDATSGKETYGAGRYLLDTAKGADLGTDNGRLVLDFNFAYNPSCSYDPQWVCPLAPPENRIEVAITAGERVA